MQRGQHGVPRTLCAIAAAVVVLSVGPVAAAGTGGYDLDWWTVDGGGGTFSTGGTFELGGTAGQPDAGSHSGGVYALGGGFWQMIELLLSVHATPVISAEIAGVPLAAGGFTDYSVQLDDGTPATLTAPGTVTVGEDTYAFLRWDLGGAPQPDYQPAVAFTLLSNTTATALYLSPPADVVVEMEITENGKLNPDGPAPKSLGIHSIGLAGNPPDTPIAIKIGDQPDSGWLQFGRGFPLEDLDDLFPIATQPAWHTAAEWAARLRGLTPATAYTFCAKAQAGTHETSLSQSGPFETSADCDVNRSGVVNALDWACIKHAILLGSLSWACDVNDSRVLDGDDLGDTMSRSLTP